MLGDLIHEALERVGITPQRASFFLGDCCCEERRQKLNALDNWARRVLRGRVEDALHYFNQIIGANDEPGHK